MIVAVLEAIAKLVWLGAVTKTVRVVRQGAVTTLQ